MKAPLGYEAGARKQGRNVLVEYNSDALVNSHIGVMGMTGAGKSYLMRHMISHMAKSSRVRTRVHVFDVHGDMKIPGESSVMFSEQTPYGLNPLRVSPHRDFGGVRKCIQTFIDILNKTAKTPIGLKQEACLRKLLLDVYERHGFTNDPETWWVDPSQEVLVGGSDENRLYLDIPLADKDTAKKLAPIAWDPNLKLWWIPPDEYQGGITQWLPKTVGRSTPTIDEVLTYAKRVQQAILLGSNQRAVQKLEILNRMAAGYHRKILNAAKSGDDGWKDLDTEATLDKAGHAAVEAYADFVEAVRTGKELNNFTKYGAPDVFDSVVERLENLLSTGIFKNGHIPFAPNATVWRSQLNALSHSEAKMFVFFRLQEIWRKALERGEGPHGEIHDVLVLDEFGRYATAVLDPDNIINVLARESRKYGIALMIAGQSYEDFPPVLMGSLGTKVVLGVDDGTWKPMSNQMRIPEELLAWIRLKQTFAVQFKEDGATKNEWRGVYSM